jgi:putative SOS response-associated peptidase YedK
MLIASTGQGKAMCYSAQIYADFRKYQRFGGTLDIKAYTALAGWARQKGTWTKAVPKTMRRSMLDAGSLAPELAAAAAAANAAGAAALDDEIAAQSDRREKAQAKLASAKPTKAAENDLRVSTNKIETARRKLADLVGPAEPDGMDRIWPGHFAPVLIRDPETGERLIVPMRYRCRLPGWTEAMEIEKPGTYNARRDKLSTVWRRVFGVHHGLIAASRFFESVHLHDLQQRALAPGEREQNVELVFTPQTGEDLLIACLYTYTEASGAEPAFYSFAAITHDPPPEVAAAGHDRCIVTICDEDIDAWLNPTAHTPIELQAMLDRGIAERPYFEHALAG